MIFIDNGENPKPLKRAFSIMPVDQYMVTDLSYDKLPVSMLYRAYEIIDIETFTILKSRYINTHYMPPLECTEEHKADILMKVLSATVFN